MTLNTSDTNSAGQAPALRSGALFALCTRRTRLSDGSLRIRCVRGLWSVEGKDRNLVRREAMHYWQQYHSDGEYAAILANTKASRGA